MPAQDPTRHITTLCVERDCMGHPYTREIRDRTGLPVQVVENGEAPFAFDRCPDSLSSGKRCLFLCRNRGKFFKPCPGTREYLCCGYHVLNTGMNCPMDCVYCILQAYLNNPWLSFFVNIEDLFAELDQELNANPHRLYRIGTGEFTDSLALDGITGLSRRLINYFRDRDNAVLELKTKSAAIGNLEKLDHRGRTVLAWSLNSPAVVAREELRTAGIADRLAAAALCAEWGYRLAFHFDPVIWHQGWREGYRDTIRRLFAAVPGESIVWISLGGLRFLPQLKPIAASRFPASRFFYAEFIEGLDGKSRYFRSQRTEMYKFITGELYKFMSAGTCLYFCMESDAVWQEVLGFRPADRGGLPAMLDQAMYPGARR